MQHQVPHKWVGWLYQREQDRHPTSTLPGALNGLHLTTLGDVHVLQKDDGRVQVHTAQFLGLQVGLALLLPELDPADVTAAVKRVPL